LVEWFWAHKIVAKFHQWGGGDFEYPKNTRSIEIPRGKGRGASRKAKTYVKKMSYKRNERTFGKAHNIPWRTI